MLRYLRRVEDLTTGKLRWGMLTNGGQWRLYYQGARSVSEQFFEIDLTAILAIPGHEGGLFALSEEECRHWLRVFALVFGRQAFLPTPSDGRTFHQRALAEGRFYEDRVAANLSDLVFGQVFPELARAIAAAAPAAPLQEAREAALILLYRLLFILYAEDRDLLPVRDPRYEDYGLRERVRGDIGRRKDRNDAFSDTAARYWSALDDLCRAIDLGDRSIGLPPYNGGLFDAERTPLLTTIRLGDAIMANVIDALSFERTADGRKYINYRDLSVQQLGSIYERLLEHEIIREAGRIVIRPNVFARKGSGSYYTPDDLVGLIIRETVAPLVAQRTDTFRARADELAGGKQPEDYRLGILKRLDPAERLLELKICDPAMGSGHFLVSLVDYLADQVIAAMADAEAIVAWGDYISPLGGRIEAIRNTILGNAEERGWTVDPAQLDDRHIIRRMVLKRCVYGVDKNLMAVELAKVSLWLHTFTVGAPLSFLDHHLRHGDSLFGSWVRGGIDKAASWGKPLLLHEPMRRAMRAAASMQVIEGLTDAEIAEAERSELIFEEVREMTAPLDAFLSFIHAIDWLDPKAKEDKAALHAFFDGQFGDPVQIALGKATVANGRVEAARFTELLAKARELIDGGTFLQLAGRLPRRVVGLGIRKADRRVRRDHRQPALGPDEIAAGRMVRHPPAGNCIGPARRRPQAHDRRVGSGGRSTRRGLCQGRGARRSGVPHRPRLRRLSAALRRRHEHLFAVRRAGDGARQAERHGRPPDPLRHRLGQDRRPFFKGVRRRPAEGLYDFVNGKGDKMAFFSRCPCTIQFCISSSAHRPSIAGAICILSTRVSELNDPERCSADRRGLCPRQSEHRDGADLPQPPRRRSDDRDLCPPAGPGGPVRRRGQGLAGQIRDHVPYDQRLRSFPHAPGTGGARRRLPRRRQPFRSPAGEWVPLYEGDGAGYSTTAPRRRGRSAQEPTPSCP